MKYKLTQDGMRTNIIRKIECRNSHLFNFLSAINSQIIFFLDFLWVGVAMSWSIREENMIILAYFQIEHRKFRFLCLD